MTPAPAGPSPEARTLGALTLGITLGLVIRQMLATAGRAGGHAAVPSAAGPALPPDTLREAAIAAYRDSPQALTQADTHVQLRAQPVPGHAPAPDGGHAARRHGPLEQRAASQLYLSAALLAASVLGDSALEHYRGGYANPGMFAPLAGAALALAWALRGARPGRPAPALPALPALPFGAACAIGAAGVGFHAYNVLRRPGGLRWANLFYGAPLGAPAALSLAGLLGLGARASASGAPTLARLPSGQALCALTAAGLAGASLEAALLHFRGAYHHPAMWLPVSLPPVGAALLAADALRAPAPPRRLTRAWLALCTWLGVAGAALHARGIARQMGGWRNWSQNLLAGPPLPAPPSFSALALAGRAALALRARDPGRGARQDIARVEAA